MVGEAGAGGVCVSALDSDIAAGAGAGRMSALDSDTPGTGAGCVSALDSDAAGTESVQNHDHVSNVIIELHEGEYLLLGMTRVPRTVQQKNLRRSFHGLRGTFQWFEGLHQCKRFSCND